TLTTAGLPATGSSSTSTCAPSGLAVMLRRSGALPVAAAAIVACGGGRAPARVRPSQAPASASDASPSATHTPRARERGFRGSEPETLATSAASAVSTRTALIDEVEPVPLRLLLDVATPLAQAERESGSASFGRPAKSRSTRL